MFSWILPWWARLCCTTRLWRTCLVSPTYRSEHSRLHWTANSLLLHWCSEFRSTTDGLKIFKISPFVSNVVIISVVNSWALTKCLFPRDLWLQNSEESPSKCLWRKNNVTWHELEKNKCHMRFNKIKVYPGHVYIIWKREYCHQNEMFWNAALNSECGEKQN